MSYRLRTLGRIRISSEEGSEIELRSAKHTALFLYLNAESRGNHLRADLCEMFWTTERSRARHSLSQALYDIRNRVGSVLATPGEGVTLDAPGAWYDVEELEERMSREEHGAAVELYAGTYAVELDDVGTDGFERWLEAERRRIQVLGRNAFRRYIDALEEKGDWSRLAQVARRFLKRAPTDVDAQRSFIRSLWLGGDRASALEYFASVQERRPDLAEQLRPLIDRIEGRSQNRVRETPDREEPPLLGREDELRRLRRVSRSLEGPVVVHLEGEAGVGKTRLVQELTRILELDGFRILQSRCWEAESDVPYSAVAEALEPSLGSGRPAGPASGSLQLARSALFPRSQEPVDPAADREALKELRRRVFEEVTCFVRDLVDDRPALWVVEDIQWADRTSAALLHYLLRRLTDVPLLVAFTSRPTPDRDDGLARYLDQPSGVERLALEPLDESTTRELLEEASGETLPAGIEARIVSLSGGNPYFALQLLRTCEDRAAAGGAEQEEVLGRDLVDDRLESVLRERLRSVSVDGLKVLEAVAVLGGRTSWDLVLSLARVDVHDPSWICDQLTRQRLLHTEEGEVEFAHDILRELVYADLGEIRRYSLHQMAAERLAREGDVSRGVLAKHFHLGGDPDRAFHYALAAARDAESRGAHQEAASYADVALSAADDSGAPIEASEVELRRLAARAYSSGGDLDRAARRLEPLMDVEVADVSEGDVRGLLELAEIRIDEAKIEEARASLHRADACVRASVSGPVADALDAERLSLELKVEIYDGDRIAIDTARERLKNKLEDHSSSSEEEFQRASLALAGYDAFFTSASKARALIKDVVVNSVSDRIEIKIAFLLGAIEVRSCHWDRAEYLFNRGRKKAQDRGDVLTTGYFDNNLGCLYLGKGDWKRAENALGRSSSLDTSLENLPQYRIYTLLNQANAALYQLKMSQARRAYDMALAEAEATGSKKYEAEARTCLGLLDLLAGDRRAADRQYRKVRSLIDERSLSQEGFKLAWFSAFCGDDGSPSEVLRERAESYRNTDTLSYLKLLWLAEISDGDGEGGPSEEVRRRLRDQGLLWFEKFADRWMRVSRGNLAAV